MRKSIGYIELFIVLSVIVIGVRVWNYKKPEDRTVPPTPRPVSNTTTTMPIIKIEKVSPNGTILAEYCNTPCKRCGKTNVLCVYYNEIPSNTRQFVIGTICDKCGFVSAHCPKCGSYNLEAEWRLSYTYDIKRRTVSLCSKCKSCKSWSVDGKVHW